MADDRLLLDRQRPVEGADHDVGEPVVDGVVIQVHHRFVASHGCILPRCAPPHQIQIPLGVQLWEERVVHRRAGGQLLLQAREGR